MLPRASGCGSVSFAALYAERTSSCCNRSTPTGCGSRPSNWRPSSEEALAMTRPATPSLRPSSATTAGLRGPNDSMQQHKLTTRPSTTTSLVPPYPHRGTTAPWPPCGSASRRVPPPLFLFLSFFPAHHISGNSASLNCSPLTPLRPTSTGTHSMPPSVSFTYLGRPNNECELEMTLLP